MKKLTKKSLFIIPLLLLLNSCGFHDGLTSNINASQTSVVLSQKNYKVIDKVSGTATAKYIFGIGGISAKALVEKARTSMVTKNKLNGGAKAYIYPTVDEHMTFIFPFYIQKTVTYSGCLIEFAE